MGVNSLAGHLHAVFLGVVFQKKEEENIYLFYTIIDFIKNAF